MAYSSNGSDFHRMRMGVGRANKKQVNYIFAFFVRFYNNNLDKL